MPPPLVLMYHYVEFPSPFSRVRGLYTTPASFDRQVKWLLRNHYTFATLEQVAPGDFENQPHKTVILTFDDGSASVFQAAFPVLRRYGIPAVIYPVISLLNRHDCVIRGSANAAPVSFLTPSQISCLAEAGLEVGSHLVSHTPVDELPDHTLREELAQSKVGLERISGKPVVSVAYPYGRYDNRAIRYAKELGFRYGLTTDQPVSREYRLFTIPRLPVKGSRWHHWHLFHRNLRRYEG